MIIFSCLLGFLENQIKSFDTPLLHIQLHSNSSSRMNNTTKIWLTQPKRLKTAHQIWRSSKSFHYIPSTSCHIVIESVKMQFQIRSVIVSEYHSPIIAGWAFNCPSLTHKPKVTKCTSHTQLLALLNSSENGAGSFSFVHYTDHNNYSWVDYWLIDKQSLLFTFIWGV